LLELVDLDRRYASRQPHRLSGGAASGSAREGARPAPAVVLLDEPFSGTRRVAAVGDPGGRARGPRRRGQPPSS
jgi:ABC-type proline/glycine betaine transport system ATPase subunit